MRIDVDIPDKLNRKLRIEMAKRLNGKHGDLKRVVIEALNLWLASGERTRADDKES